MKIGKEDGQKIFLGVLLAAGLLYGYFTMLLGPLNTAEEGAQATVHDKGPMVDEDKKKIKMEAEMKAKADQAEATLKELNKLIPDGSPVAWFPPMAIDFFKRQGIERCAVHHGEEGADKDLTGFKSMAWGLDISHVEIVPLATAIAGFENDHPLMEIDSLHIDSGKDNVQYQTARLNVNTIVKQ